MESHASSFFSLPLPVRRASKTDIQRERKGKRGGAKEIGKQKRKRNESKVFVLHGTTTASITTATKICEHVTPSTTIPCTGATCLRSLPSSFPSFLERKRAKSDKQQAPPPPPLEEHRKGTTRKSKRATRYPTNTSVSQLSSPSRPPSLPTPPVPFCL